MIRLGSETFEVLLAKITVSDLRKSFDFYSNVLGLRQIEIPDLPRPAIDDLESPFIEVCLNFSGSPADAHLCLMRQKGVVPDRKQAELTCVGIKTPDARGAINRAREAGCIVRIEPTHFLGIEVGTVLDPDGYTVEILQAQSV